MGLCLTVRPGDAVVIGEGAAAIRVKLVEIRHLGQTRFWVEAPKDMPISREPRKGKGPRMATDKARIEEGRQTA